MTEQLRLMVRIKANLPLVGRYRPSWGGLHMSVPTLIAGIFEDGEFAGFEETETGILMPELGGTVKAVATEAFVAYRANEAVDAYGKAECPGEHMPELLIEEVIVILPEVNGVQRSAQLDLLLLKQDVVKAWDVHNASPTPEVSDAIAEAMTNNATLGMEIAATKVAAKAVVNRAMARMQASDPMTEPPPAPPIG